MIPGSLTTIPLYTNTPVPEWEQTYIGPTGIRLSLKLSTVLQPANWEVIPPPFISCLEQIVQELTLANNTTGKVSEIGNTTTTTSSHSRKNSKTVATTTLVSSVSTPTVITKSTSLTSSLSDNPNDIHDISHALSINVPSTRSSARKQRTTPNVKNDTTTINTPNTKTITSTTTNKDDDHDDIIVMMEIDKDGNILLASPDNPNPPINNNTLSSRKRGISVDNASLNTITHDDIKTLSNTMNNRTTSSTTSHNNTTRSTGQRHNNTVHTPNVSFAASSASSSTTSNKKQRTVSIGESTYSSTFTSDEEDIHHAHHTTATTISRTSSRSKRSTTTTASISNPNSDNEGFTDSSLESYDNNNDLLTLIHKQELELLHNQALKIDLGMNPLSGQSWLTSTLIDALLFRFACYFPTVTFLPCSFAAYELVQAARHPDKLKTLIIHDVLGKLVTIRPDQIGPIEDVPGYNRLPIVIPNTSTTGNGNSTTTNNNDSFTLSDTNITTASNINNNNLIALPSGIPPLAYQRRTGSTTTATTSGIVSSTTTTSSTSRNRSNSNRKNSESDASPILTPISTNSTNKKGSITNKSGTLLGRNLYKSRNKPLIFFYNAGGNHWVVVRVDMSLRKRIELYEPMGKPSARANVYREAG